MIDIESEIFTALKKELTENFPGIYVTGESVNAPPKFPCVSIEESDNYTPFRHIDSGDNEKYADLTYEVNVYSAKATGKKTEAKKIASVVSDWMYNHNFRRYFQKPVPNAQDHTIYRIFARYRAVTDGNHLYRR